MPPASPVVKYEVKDRIAWITFNRPKALNAMNDPLRLALGDAYTEAINDDDVLVVITTGEGGRAFSAGADLKQGRDRAKNHDPPSRHQAMTYWEKVDNCPKPIIAAIDGYCLGGGMEYSLRCDIRIATEKSTFALPEPRIGITAPYGMQHLSRNIPLGEAMYILLTGSQITAERAYQIGLIQSLVPDREALFAEAERIANEIKLCAPSIIKALRQFARTGHNMSLDQASLLAEHTMRDLHNTEESMEGRKAFFEKRPPNWKSPKG